MRKITYEMVKKSFEEKGHELISEKYVNAQTNLEAKCDKGHIYNVTWNNFKKGGCPYCSGRARHAYDKIKNDIESEKYKLVSKEYKNNNTKLKLTCPNGNEWFVTYKDWKNGIRCNCIMCCATKKWHSHKYTQKEVGRIIKNRGFELKSKYEGPSKKINVNCPNSHNINIYFGNFVKGHGCKYCAWDNAKQYNDLTLWEIYSKICRSISNKTYKENKYLINPNGLEITTNKFHIDHVYSISDGYKNKIPPYIISSMPNLQVLWCSENISKNKESWTTKQKLFDKYFNYFEEQNGIKDTL